jgi:hypothetical protein
VGQFIKDFLVAGPREATFDIVAGNPPYLRWVRVPKPLQALYASHVPLYASKDLLHSFLDRCTQVLHPAGKIGLVTADRWLFNSGARRLREQMGARVSIRHIERLDASTAFYRPKDRKAGTAPRIHPIAVVLSRESVAGSRILDGEAIFPGTDATQYEGLTTLGEVAEVRIAPWLGSFGVFVVDEATAAALPREHLVSAVDTDDIVAGILRPARRFAIRTDPGIEPPASVLAHLTAQMHRMAARGVRACTWLPPESFHRFDLTRPSLLIPRIAKAPKAVRVPPGVLPINHNLSVVCAEPGVLEQVERSLQSPEATQWVKDFAPRLENGYFSLTTSMLRRMPLFR